MRLSFVQPAGFVSEWKHFRLSDEDAQALERQLDANPAAGAVLSGTGGARKIRFSPPSRRSGKSGAYRIVYAYKPERGTLWLLSIFAKADQANLTAREKAVVKKLIKSL
jgi:hypothetical protein